MKQLLLYMCCGVLSTAAYAQTHLFTERIGHPLSPAEQRHDLAATDMDVRLQQQLFEQPAYRAIAQLDSTNTATRYRSGLYAAWGQGASKGDFLPYEGNAYRDARLFGTGTYAIRSAGVIFGSAQYARGKHDNIGWAATRQPQLYLPYISCDSIGGDYLFEDYQVEGGYAFTTGHWHWGVKATFHGEQAWRKTDPRALNNTTWLHGSIGAGRMFNGHLLMWSGGIGRNKQHQTLRYWRPGQQDRFFVGYGFGLYDIRKSAVLFGYSRMHYINHMNTCVNYASPTGRPLILHAGMEVDFKHMKAEESDIQNLYSSKTLILSPSVRIDWQAGRAFLLSLHAEGSIQSRRGYENIFEEYLVDEGQNLYDFRQIDSRQNYNLDINQGTARLRLRYRPTSRYSVGIGGGTSFCLYKETYPADGYRIENNSIFPHVTLDFHLNMPHNEWSINMLYGRQLRLNDKYEVSMRNPNIAHLDFQHAFAPYAYRNSTFSTFTLASTFTHHFGACAVGASLHLMLTSGKRNNDAAFTSKIGFASSAPMISPTPDQHDEHWAKTALFFIF